MSGLRSVSNKGSSIHSCAYVICYPLTGLGKRIVKRLNLGEISLSTMGA